MPLTSIVLEYSSDPVSDTTPTWVTVSQAELRSVEWWAGVGSEGDDLEAGGATIVLVNVARKWEPFFGSNVIDTHQRFKLRLTGPAGTFTEGVWFITSISVDYPGNTEWSEVTFECADGTEILALDHLPSLDPPDAESYEDVINFYEPWGYWRLGEPEGTRARARVATKFRGRGKNRRKIRRRRGTTYTTREEAGGVSGPAGVYVALPGLGQPGAIVGDGDTAVHFVGGSDRVNIPITDDDFRNLKGLTVLAWVNMDDLADIAYVVRGPADSLGVPVFRLYVQAGGTVGFALRNNDATDHVAALLTAVSAGTWSFLAGVWDGSKVRVFVDGVEGTPAGQGHIRDGVSGSVQIWASDSNAYGYADEVAIVERALTADQVASIYTAGVERGFPRQTASERIQQLVTSGLWDESGVIPPFATSRDVVPRMMFGQSRLDELAETAHAEGPSTLFFFDGTGDPIYLGNEWQTASSVYRSVQATFGQSEFGEVPVDGLEPVYDHETYNVIQASCEGSGELVEVEDTVASGKRGRRVLDDYTDLLLAEHMETESLAAALLATYKDPVRKVAEISVSGWDDRRLDTILSLDIGDMVRVNWSGETGARNGQVANIIRKHKSLDNTERPHVLRCTYRLSRGFDALEGSWRAGVAGWSEAGVTTTAA